MACARSVWEVLLGSEWWYLAGTARAAAAAGARSRQQVVMRRSTSLRATGRSARSNSKLKSACWLASVLLFASPGSWARFALSAVHTTELAHRPKNCSKGGRQSFDHKAVPIWTLGDVKITCSTTSAP